MGVIHAAAQFQLSAVGGVGNSLLKRNLTTCGQLYFLRTQGIPAFRSLREGTPSLKLIPKLRSLLLA